MYTNMYYGARFSFPLAISQISPSHFTRTPIIPPVLHCTPQIARVTSPQIDDRRLGDAASGSARRREWSGTVHKHLLPLELPHPIPPIGWLMGEGGY